MRSTVLVCLSLAACASPARTAEPAPASAGGECPAREALGPAEEALGACRATHASDPGWPARDAYEALIPRLTAHLASLEPARFVTADEMQPFAEGIWALLDQVDFPSGTKAARSRAEDAAERLLRDRDIHTAPGAAIEALDAVTQIGTVADPSGGADPCAAEDLRAQQTRAESGACE